MECTILHIIACFSWSGFFIDSGLSFQEHGDSRVTEYGTYDPYPDDGIEQSAPYTLTSLTKQDAENPYMSVALGYETTIGRSLRFTIMAGHRSSIDTGRDKGTNFISVHARYFPFLD